MGSVNRANKKLLNPRASPSRSRQQAPSLRGSPHPNVHDRPAADNPPTEFNELRKALTELLAKEKKRQNNINKMNLPPRQGADRRHVLPESPAVIDLLSSDEEESEHEIMRGPLSAAYEHGLSPPPQIQQPPDPAAAVQYAINGDPLVNPFAPQQAINDNHVFGAPPFVNGDPNAANDIPAHDIWGNLMGDGGDGMRFDDFDDMDVQDADLERAMMEGYKMNVQSRPAAQEEDQMNGFNQQNAVPDPPVESRAECIGQVVAVFPDICRNHCSELYDTSELRSSDRMIAHILDKMEKGILYPKAKDVQKTLKRKRVVDENEEAAQKYGSADRIMPENITSFKPYIKNVLSAEFPHTPMTFIESCLSNSGLRLFSAYRVLEEAERTFDPLNPPYNQIKTARKMRREYREENLEDFISTITEDPARIEILRELQAARRVRKKADAKRNAERQLELDEKENILKAQAEGTMSECGCCFGDFPLNRMVHCDSEDVLHWFCRGCARQTAETEIGNSKYQLHCMSMDGCEAGFSKEQRSRFLDEITTIALERNEQEAVLRMAGIENLASCPFCPYAAEYPTVEENREFRCQAPDCEKVSCRLCKLESHIPKSCEEHAKENGLSIRRQIEEAMSAALIRKCNKCGTPFIKEEGCNKMTCTRNGCYNIQCYVCSKSCTYDHFDDSRRGGKPGNCPLFESVEQRHNEEVQKAEKEALDKVRAEHPEYTEEDLKIKMSEAVLKDDERRKANNPHAALHQYHPFPALGAFNVRPYLPRNFPAPARVAHRGREELNRPAGADDGRERFVQWNPVLGRRPAPIADPPALNDVGLQPVHGLRALFNNDEPRYTYRYFRGGVAGEGQAINGPPNNAPNGEVEENGPKSKTLRFLPRGEPPEVGEARAHLDNMYPRRAAFHANGENQANNGALNNVVNQGAENQAPNPKILRLQPRREHVEEARAYLNRVLPPHGAFQANGVAAEANNRPSFLQQALEARIGEPPVYFARGDNQNLQAQNGRAENQAPAPNPLIGIGPPPYYNPHIPVYPIPVERHRLGDAGRQTQTQEAMEALHRRQQGPQATGAVAAAVGGDERAQEITAAALRTRQRIDELRRQQSEVERARGWPQLRFHHQEIVQLNQQLEDVEGRQRREQQFRDRMGKKELGSVDQGGEQK